MLFGVCLPGRGPLARPDVLVKIAERADTLRYASVFVTDHVVIPVTHGSVYPYSPTGRTASDWTQGYFEPLSLMSYLAGATRHVRLGTSVLVVPYRNPVLVAKMLATLDVMSGGRVILGAGVGWLREEFEALGSPPFDARGRVTDEFLSLMRATWTQEPVEWKGEFYRLAAVSALPKPVQKGGIPIWVGGHTPAALKRAGVLGDGWHPIGMRPPAHLHPGEYRDRAAEVREHARKAGRDPRGITFTFRVPLELKPRTAKSAGGDRVPFRGTAAEVIADIRTYEDLGVSHFVFDPAPQDLRGQLATLERFADEVRPKVARGRR
jgi:probable F420-dependent oxidoreductase